MDKKAPPPPPPPLADPTWMDTLASYTTSMKERVASLSASLAGTAPDASSVNHNSNKAAPAPTPSKKKKHGSPTKPGMSKKSAAAVADRSAPAPAFAGLKGALQTKALETGQLARDLSKRSSARLGEALGREVGDHAAAAAALAVVVIALLLARSLARCFRSKKEGDEGEGAVRYPSASQKESYKTTGSSTTSGGISSAVGEIPGSSAEKAADPAAAATTPAASDGEKTTGGDARDGANEEHQPLAAQDASDPSPTAIAVAAPPDFPTTAARGQAEENGGVLPLPIGEDDVVAKSAYGGSSAALPPGVEMGRRSSDAKVAAAIDEADAALSAAALVLEQSADAAVAAAAAADPSTDVSASFSGAGDLDISCDAGGLMADSRSMQGGTGGVRVESGDVPADVASAPAADEMIGVEGDEGLEAAAAAERVSGAAADTDAGDIPQQEVESLADSMAMEVDCEQEAEVPTTPENTTEKKRRLSPSARPHPFRSKKGKGKAASASASDEIEGDDGVDTVAVAIEAEAAAVAAAAALEGEGSAAAGTEKEFRPEGVQASLLTSGADAGDRFADPSPSAAAAAATTPSPPPLVVAASTPPRSELPSAEAEPKIDGEAMLDGSKAPEGEEGAGVDLAVEEEGGAKGVSQAEVNVGAGAVAEGVEEGGPSQADGGHDAPAPASMEKEERGQQAAVFETKPSSPPPLAAAPPAAASNESPLPPFHSQALHIPETASEPAKTGGADEAVIAAPTAPVPPMIGASEPARAVAVAASAVAAAAAAAAVAAACADVHSPPPPPYKDVATDDDSEMLTVGRESGGGVQQIHGEKKREDEPDAVGAREDMPEDDTIFTRRRAPPLGPETVNGSLSTEQDRDSLPNIDVSRLDESTGKMPAAPQASALGGAPADDSPDSSDAKFDRSSRGASFFRKRSVSKATSVATSDDAHGEGEGSEGTRRGKTKKLKSLMSLKSFRRNSRGKSASPAKL